MNEQIKDYATRMVSEDTWANCWSLTLRDCRANRTRRSGRPFIANIWRATIETFVVGRANDDSYLSSGPVLAKAHDRSCECCSERELVLITDAETAKDVTGGRARHYYLARLDSAVASYRRLIVAMARSHSAPVCRMVTDG